MLSGGMNIPVDGIILHSSGVKVSEAAMTGESDELQKDIVEHCLEKKKKKEDKFEEDLANKLNPKRGPHDVNSPLMLSGTQVAVGTGEMLVIVVGKNSAIGQIMATLESKIETTPL